MYLIIVCSALELIGVSFEPNYEMTNDNPDKVFSAKFDIDQRNLENNVRLYPKG